MNSEKGCKYVTIASLIRAAMIRAAMIRAAMIRAAVMIKMI